MENAGATVSTSKFQHNFFQRCVKMRGSCKVGQFGRWFGNPTERKARRVQSLVAQTLGHRQWCRFLLLDIFVDVGSIVCVRFLSLVRLYVRIWEGGNFTFEGRFDTISSPPFYIHSHPKVVRRFSIETLLRAPCPLVKVFPAVSVQASLTPCCRLLATTFSIFKIHCFMSPVIQFLV